MSDGGRGAELSELVVFDGKLLSVDDRSGVGECEGGEGEWVIECEGVK